MRSVTRGLPCGLCVPWRARRLGGRDGASVGVRATRPVTYRIARGVGMIRNRGAGSEVGSRKPGLKLPSMAPAIMPAPVEGRGTIDPGAIVIRVRSATGRQKEAPCRCRGTGGTGLGLGGRVAPWELGLLMHVIVGVMGSMVWPGACMARVRLPLDPSARQGGVSACGWVPLGDRL